jgi:hypothetical protein
VPDNLFADRFSVRDSIGSAELRDSSFKAQIRETDTLVTEVLVQRGDAVLALAHVAPWKNSAVATIWRIASETEGLPNAMTNGC